MEIGTGFEQVGGEAMAKHGIDTFLNPGAAGGLDASVVGRLCYFFLTDNGGQAIALLGVGSVGNAAGPLERLDVEEAQGAEMVGHRTGTQFVHGEELGLVLADVLRSKPIGRAVEVLGEPLDEAKEHRP